MTVVCGDLSEFVNTDVRDVTPGNPRIVVCFDAHRGRQSQIDDRVVLAGADRSTADTDRQSQTPLTARVIDYTLDDGRENPSSIDC